MGNKCNIKEFLATKQFLPLLSFARNRLNLAEKEILAEYETFVQVFNVLFSKLCTPIFEAKLSEPIPLVVKTMNNTLWNTMYSMLKRYQELRDFTSKLDEVVIDALLPKQADNRRIRSVVNELFKLQSVTWKIHENSFWMADVRGLFDCVFEEFPVISSRLSTTASIIHSLTFELALVKIQHENSAVFFARPTGFCENVQRDAGIVCTRCGFGEKICRLLRLCWSKCAEIMRRVAASTVISAFFFLLQSRAFIIRPRPCAQPRRKGIAPTTFEGQMFLYKNRDLWGPKELSKVVPCSQIK